MTTLIPKFLGGLGVDLTDTVANFDSGIEIDNITIDGTEIDLSSGDLTIDVAGDVILDAGGGDVFFKAAGTTFGSATNTSGNLIIKSGTTTAATFSGANLTLAGTLGVGAITTTGAFKGADGYTIGNASVAAVMTLAATGVVTFVDDILIKDGGTIGSASDADSITIAADGVVTMNQIPVFSAGINVSGGSIAGSGAGLTAGTTPLTTLDIDGGTDIGEAIVDADLFIIDNGGGGTNRKTAASRLKTYISAGSTVALDDITAGDAASTLTTSAGNITIDAQGDNTDIILKGTDGGADTTFLTIDGSAAGKATFNNEVVSGAVITSGAGLIIADAGNIGSASDTDSIAIASDGVVTMNQIPVFSAGINVSGGTIAGTIATAAQTNITSLGTLTALTVDDVAVNGKVITMTGSTNDTAVFTAGTNGTLSIVTTDTAAAAANIEITADGTAELAGTTVTLNSSTTIEINADNATTFFKDGSTAIAAVAGTPQAPGVTQNAGFVPVGSILAHGSATVPTGWLDATAGAAVSRTTFSVLFAVLSTLYGAGNGTTTFNLPSLGDRMIMGKGTNNGTIGASSTGASGSFVVATASGSAALTKTTSTFATSAKDSSTATALTNVTAGGHTHNVTMPSQICMYIIKA